MLDIPYQNGIKKQQVKNLCGFQDNHCNTILHNMYIKMIEYR